MAQHLAVHAAYMPTSIEYKEMRKKIMRCALVEGRRNKRAEWRSVTYMYIYIHIYRLYGECFAALCTPPPPPPPPPPTPLRAPCKPSRRVPPLEAALRRIHCVGRIDRINALECAVLRLYYMRARRAVYTTPVFRFSDFTCLVYRRAGGGGGRGGRRGN